ncbi:hypothetical protein ElyMa_007064200 [Elysia marginata]|uniref:Uncharacterized protein n=1 Tax=Elysia marginata TaxID=1093978 RepID=A0AAV4JVD9_9GAST|nr:hypothetical protein ElyMa_007064200 [Elysia marginata]
MLSMATYDPFEFKRSVRRNPATMRFLRHGTSLLPCGHLDTWRPHSQDLPVLARRAQGEDVAYTKSQRGSPSSRPIHTATG